MVSRLGLSASWVVVLLALATSGCSKERTDPCSLLGVSEAQLFDSTISVSRSMPPQAKEDNSLCLYYNANGEPRLMLFVWTDDKVYPMDVTQSGMSGSDSEVIEITDVGEKAAAGFRSGELKLFAARNRKGMIGIRVRDPVMKDDATFEEVKALAAKLLGRLK